MPNGSPLRGVQLSRLPRPLVILLVLVIVAWTSSSFAHRVVLFAYVEGSTVFAQSSFSNGKRCQNSKIEVFDMFGNKLLEGKTDGNGAFSFTPPERTDLRIVLTASMGHRDEYVIRAGELPDGRERKISQHETHAAEKRAFPAEKGEEQKKPLMRLLENRRTEGISFVRLMGGIGFIFGLMGIAVYVRKRRAR